MEEQYEKAFWDMLDQDPPDTTHISKILEEIKQILYSFVPSRADVHHAINNDMDGPIEWDFQVKLIIWAEKFQAPVYDQMTQGWKKKVPEKLSIFLKKYSEHLTDIRKGIEKYKNPTPPPGGKNGVPDNLATGRSA